MLRACYSQKHDPERRGVLHQQGGASELYVCWGLYETAAPGIICVRAWDLAGECGLLRGVRPDGPLRVGGVTDPRRARALMAELKAALRACAARHATLQVLVRKMPQ